MPNILGMSTIFAWWRMAIERGDIAIRLVEERTRIGYSQADFARKLVISREMLRRYEVGTSGLSGEFLAESATFGIDVQYVLTGVRSANNEDAVRAVQPTVHVSGGSANVIATNHGPVTMVATQRHVTNTKAEIKPGDEHITEHQAAVLTALVADVIETEAKLKQKPKGHRAVWGALNAHCGVTRYRLIRLTDFGKAEKYLRQWIGRLNSAPSAPIKTGDAWRKRHYAYIKINCKDDPAWVTRYVTKNFSVSSLTELSNDQLERTYRAVASRKRKAS
ncbi:MAG: helix-turn-helix transcriptional regulator [Azonexus sp.]|jgi:hypothetical protein|nr:helix-turn-helix transcriptional regulator [Azonexus sp.]